MTKAKISPKQISLKVASKAGRELGSSKASRAQKSVIASALTQARPKPGKK